MRAFASALDQIPLALAENSGLSPIDALADIKSRQVVDGNYRLGIDCVGAGENDMKKQHVFDPLVSKRQQYLLATQLVRAVLKVSSWPLSEGCAETSVQIDDVITDNNYE